MALTAWHYSSKPMWRDEWFTYSTAERTLPQMARLLSHDDGGLVGFYLIMHAWMNLGDSLTWVRLPAAITTVVLTGLTALIGKRIGGPLVGALAGMLVAVLPSVTDHAQEARAYPLVVAATTATVLAALRYRESPSGGRSTALTMVAVLAVVVHPLPGAPAVVGVMIGLLLAPEVARRARIVLLATPAGVVALALVAWGASQGGESSNPGGLQSLGFLLQLRFAVAPTWPLLAALVLLSGIGVLTLVERRSSATVVVLAWTIVPVMTITGSIFAGSFFEARYIATIAPATAVLVAVGATAVGRAAGEHLGRSAHRQPGFIPPASLVVPVALIAGLMLVYLPGVAELRRSPYMGDDPRTAAAYLAAESRPGDAVIYSGSMARGLTEYYAPAAATHLDDALLSVGPVAADSTSGTEVPADQRAAAVEGVPRLWVVGTMGNSRWRAQQTVDGVTGGFTLREREDFGGWVVERWDKVSSSQG